MKNEQAKLDRNAALAALWKVSEDILRTAVQMVVTLGVRPSPGQSLIDCQVATAMEIARMGFDVGVETAVPSINHAVAGAFIGDTDPAEFEAMIDRGDATKLLDVLTKNRSRIGDVLGALRAATKARAVMPEAATIAEQP